MKVFKPVQHLLGGRGGTKNIRTWSWLEIGATWAGPPWIAWMGRALGEEAWRTWETYVHAWNCTAGGSRGIIELGPTGVHVRGPHRLIRSACLRVTTRGRATALSRALWRGSACASMRPDTAPIPEQISSGLTPRIPFCSIFCHFVPHKMSVWFISCTVLQQIFSVAVVHDPAAPAH